MPTIESSTKPLWLSDRIAPDSPTTDWALRWLIVLCLCGRVYFSVSSEIFQPMLHAVQKRNWARFFVRPSMLWALMGTVMLGFRTLLWFRYRAYKPADIPDAPSLTAIVRANNEGATVGKTAGSVVSANHTTGRLEIIVGDDGSTD